jgi:hypothetical protein
MRSASLAVDRERKQVMLAEGDKAVPQAAVETVPMILTKVTRGVLVGTLAIPVRFAAVFLHALPFLK